ncbi:lactate utilization protein [Methylonatrum kenyense]|uniref:LutC/YkgG family protein n=1 Tax=Methylonatrum kenyense TaxID=455253 RepID=UPI0020BF5C53|nr:lactate utilization protein [Methylonatrum kenyense]MCK8515678.1 lactate utilization protein [Methylonatrum kenyense]
MSSARERILGKVRRGLGVPASRGPAAAHAAREQAYAAAASPRQPWDGDSVDRFCQRFEAWAGTWQRVPDASAIPAAVQPLLAEGDALAVAAHPLLQQLDWPQDLAREHRHPADCQLAVSVADAAIAETGTLVLCSGPQSPTTLELLPETHVVVLRTETILPDMEAVWRHLQPDPAFPARSINAISGPSRTADVEQTIQLGAHGPRRLHVLLLAPDPAP